LIATRPVHHGAPALSELAAAIGYLDPLDSRTAANLKPIIETLEKVPPQMILVPSDEVLRHLVYRIDAKTVRVIAVLVAGGDHQEANNSARYRF
jgi:hypothetical protein